MYCKFLHTHTRYFFIRMEEAMLIASNYVEQKPAEAKRHFLFVHCYTYPFVLLSPSVFAVRCLLRSCLRFHYLQIESVLKQVIYMYSPESGGLMFVVLFWLFLSIDNPTVWIPIY